MLAVSLDDRELANSHQILLQVGTVARPYGWKTAPAADNLKRITSRGGSPWNIEEADIEIWLTNSRLTQATQLDANGLAIKDLAIERLPNGLNLKLPADAMYVLLQ